MRLEAATLFWSRSKRATKAVRNFLECISLPVSACESEDATQVFSRSRWVTLFAAVAALAFCVLASRSVAMTGWSLVSIGLSVLALFAFVGLLDALTCRVTLKGDALLVVHNLRCVRYSRGEIVTASWAAGVPVAIQLPSGRWVRLPTVGSSNERLARALLAWLRA